MIYVKEHTHGAGKWIYKGYKLAWESLGRKTAYYSSLNEIDADDYDVMAIDADIDLKNIQKIKKAKRVFLYVQPNKFPSPWGTHPNFVSLASDEVIDELNQLDNVYYWSFGDPSEYHFKWGQVNTVPLAYDSISYGETKNSSIAYDVCYIGGWANNGFNEKRKILINHFSHFRNSDLRCGFFINRNLSHEQENYIIANSKLTINIHDAYQRTLGFDTNERTFKSLGLNGLLVSDKVDQLQRLFPDVKCSNDPAEMLQLVEGYASMSDKEINSIKENNKEMILSNHTYIKRVEQLDTFKSP